MNTIFRHSVLVIVLFIFNNGVCQPLYNGVGHIPEPCRIDWTNAGLYSIVGATNILNIDDYTNDDDENIHDAIIDAGNSPGITIIYYPEGTYNFYEPITLASDIIIQGESQTGTIFNFIGIDRCSTCIVIEGSAPTYENEITLNISKTDKIINVSYTTNYDGYPWIIYYEKTNPGGYWGSKYSILGQISKITDYNSSTSITVKHEASKDYNTGYDLFLYRMNPIENVGIENITINRSQTDNGEGHGRTVRFNYAVNCWVRGVETKNATGYHFEIEKSAHIEISGCYIHNSYSMASTTACGETDGMGYGIVLGGPTVNCLIENNIFKKCRHSMLVGTGANTNVFTYNYSREPGQPDDLTLHGRYPFANLFEHNYVVRMKADNTHANNGPYNAFIRNIHLSSVTFELYNTPSAAILGCDLPHGPAKYSSSTSIDLFGKIPEEEGNYETWYAATHHWIYDVTPNPYHYWFAVLFDYSYFYSDRPYFLDESYTFPTIGPVFYNHSNTIPAKFRYDNSNVKTYLQYPTTTVTTSGTLPNDETWRGIVNIIESVTVPSGITLTILPGTEVRFNGYKSIYVNGGTLTADGVTFIASNPAQSWNMLKFQTSSTSVLENCILSYGNIPLYIWNVDIQVKNCTINNSTLGVYIYGSSANPTIDGCDIQDNGCAMYLTYGDPIIKNNKFNSIGESFSTRLYSCQGKFTNNTFKSRDGHCVYILGSTSMPNFEGETNGAGNYFTDCYDTYIEIAGGNPEVGFNTSGRAGYNLFEKDNFGGNAINNQSGQTIYAQLNWWTDLESQYGYPSTYSPTFAGWTVEYIPACGKPNQVGALWKGNSETDPVDEEFYAAFSLYNTKNFDSASDSLMHMFIKYPDHRLAPQALFRLASANTISENSKENEIFLSEIVYSNNYNESCKNAARTWLADYHIRHGNMKNAEEIVFLSPQGSYSERELLLTLIADYTLLDDEYNAERIANIMRQHQKDENVETDIKIALSIEGDLEQESFDKSSDQANESSDLIVNNPNPFNNSTKISFRIKEAGLVKIDVYNILGQRINTIVNEIKDVGMHHILWDGRDDNGNQVPSGLYFVNLRTKSENRALKISLIK